MRATGKQFVQTIRQSSKLPSLLPSLLSSDDGCCSSGKDAKQTGEERKARMKEIDDGSLLPRLHVFLPRNLFSAPPFTSLDWQSFSPSANRSRGQDESGDRQGISLSSDNQAIIKSSLLPSLRWIGGCGGGCSTSGDTGTPAALVVAARCSGSSQQTGRTQGREASSYASRE